MWCDVHISSVCGACDVCMCAEELDKEVIDRNYFIGLQFLTIPLHTCVKQ